MAQKPRRIGRYHLAGEIGRGQMGVVYKAHDPTIGRIVALKVLHIEGVAQPDVLRECLQNEAELAGNLRHPNIVTVYDAGVDDESGTPFIVMEYLKGPTLAELIDSGVSSQQAVYIALQLLDALDYSHKQGMVHGDLKPANIRVLEGFKVKISDFGLARSVQASTQASTMNGTFTGTAAYASPEQLRGEQTDRRSDIFSLGVSLFEMLAGVRPFEDEDLRRDEPVQERLDRIPSKFLCKVLLRALARDADQRYQTCAALADDLRRYQSENRSISSENPFIYGPPIVKPQWFCGREQEIQRVLSRLKGAIPGSSAIIGGRRIGKTSLLRMLCHPSVAREHGLTDGYAFVYLYPFIREENQHSDMETQLWRLILEGMRERMCCQPSSEALLVSMIDKVLKQDCITFNDFRTVISAVDTTGLRVVLLFDEFRHVVGNEAFKPELFGGLRDLTQNYNLTYITASGKNLRDLSKREKVAASPLWNVFTNVYLGPFSEKEAHDLVTGYTQRTDISFTAEDIDYATSISGGHPFFLQLACHYMFDAYRKGKWGRGTGQEKAKQSIEEEFFRQAESHFAEFWERSSEAERRALITLAFRIRDKDGRDHQREQPMLQAGPGLKALNERSLVTKAESGNYTVFSPLFARWIRRHAEANFDSELEPHFRYFWDQAEKDERRALCVLARRAHDRGLTAMMNARKRRRLTDPLRSSLDALMVRGLLIRTDDGEYEVFTPRFSRWVLSQRESVRDKLSSASRKVPGWFRRILGMLAAVLFIATLILPDLPDFAMNVLNIENVTSIEGLRNSAGEEIEVRAYIPKLLFVGETATIKMQTYGPEEPLFDVIVRRGSPDVVVIEKDGNVFEIECKGTDANLFSRSEYVELELIGEVPGGTLASTAVTLKTNHLLSLLVRVVVLLASGMIIFGLSMKELSQWLRAASKGKRTSGSS